VPSETDSQAPTETDDAYEPPRVDDLGSFAELTQHRSIRLVTDDARNFGTR
jgi:hypothetical protein